MENSSETYTCQHLPALQPVAFPTAFQSTFCWSFHRLQWRKRCSRMVVIIGAGFVGCGLHLPDLGLDGVPSGWRPAINAVFHVSTVGFSVGIIVGVFLKWNAVWGSVKRVFKA
ncbi:hypothetical protein BDD12DRAFT_816013 [Trichophaea hybrida]|nr:hypothetical protein BDD12DRAFT_816013 [Trichophaea hybrida]